METPEHAVMDRLPPSLPAPDSRVGCDAVLEKNELATRLQDTCDIADRLHNSRNRTQGEGADDSVHGAATQWDAFAWRIKEFDPQLGPTTFPLCELEHFGVRLERIQCGDLGNVVVNEVGAGADTDLENLPLSQRYNFLRRSRMGFGISQPVNDVGRYGLDRKPTQTLLSHVDRTPHAAQTVHKRLDNACRSDVLLTFTGDQSEWCAEFGM